MLAGRGASTRLKGGHLFGKGRHRGKKAVFASGETSRQRRKQLLQEKENLFQQAPQGDRLKKRVHFLLGGAGKRHLASERKNPLGKG